MLSNFPYRKKTLFLVIPFNVVTRARSSAKLIILHGASNVSKSMASKLQLKKGEKTTTTTKTFFLWWFALLLTCACGALFQGIKIHHNLPDESQVNICAFWCQHLHSYIWYIICTNLSWENALFLLLFWTNFHCISVMK